MKKKAVKLMSILLAAALLVCASVGGTLAWLTAKTQTVTNTFTIGNITISLTESDAVDTNADGKLDSKSFKLIPGETYTKDPTVTVDTDSEPCWLFVKVEEINDPKTYLTYSIAEGWSALGGDGNNGVYYREVPNPATVAPFPVLKDNEVTVNGTVTKDQMDALTLSGNLPKLTFTAYAVQKANFATAADAWTEAKKLG